jgi:chromosome segregation ATPase
MTINVYEITDMRKRLLSTAVEGSLEWVGLRDAFDTMAGSATDRPWETVEELTKDAEGHDDTIEDLEDQIQSLEDQVSDLEEDKRELERELSTLEDQLEELKGVETAMQALVVRCACLEKEKADAAR